MDIARYDMWQDDMKFDERGDYVLFEDYEASMKAKDSEIAKLQVVAATASRYVTFPSSYCRQALRTALAELNEGEYNA